MLLFSSFLFKFLFCIIDFVELLQIFQLVVYDDDFLGRARGSRKQRLGKDSTLGNYIKYLNFPGFLVFH